MHMRSTSSHDGTSGHFAGISEVSSTWTRVAVVDREPVFRMGLASIVARLAQTEVIYSGDHSGAVELSYSLGRGDLLIIGVESDSDLQLLRQLGLIAGLRIVAYASSNHSSNMFGCLRAGAHGYFDRAFTPSKIEDVLTSVVRGEDFVPPQLAAEAIRSAILSQRPSPSLTQRTDCSWTTREQQILQLLVDGLTNREIAEALGVSEKTVKHYMTGLMKKERVKNRTQLASLLLSEPLRSQDGLRSAMISVVDQGATVTYSTEREDELELASGSAS